MTVTKKIIKAIAACALFVSPVAKAQTVTFEKIFNLENGDWSAAGYSVQQTADGGWIIAGYNKSSSADNNVYLIKTDATGNTLWTKTFCSADNCEGYSVRQTTDGGYIIAGGSHNNTTNDGDVYLIKADSIGNLQWTKTIGGIESDFAASVRQTMDGGFIVAGNTSAFPAWPSDVYLIKTNANGDTLWTKTYGGTNEELGYSVQQTSDSGYIVSGWTQSFGAGLHDIYLVKTDNNGDTLWTKTYGGAYNDEGASVQQTSDGGYIIAGWTESFSAGRDVYLIKTGANGDTLWTKTIGNSSNYEEGFSVQQTTDGGFVIAGERGYINAGDNGGIYLVKTDTNGDTIWTKTFSATDTSNDFAYSVQQTFDGGHIIAGKTDIAGNDEWHVYLIKTDQKGDIAAGTGQTFNSIIAPKFFPNPLMGNARIEFALLHSENISIKIYNLLGVETKTIFDGKSFASGTYSVSFDANDLPSGIYFCRIHSYTSNQTIKIEIIE